MNLYDEFFALIPYLNKLGVRYAVIGGIAMAFHGRPRFTRDIDVLIHSEDIDLVRMAFQRLDYRETAAPWTFRNTNLTLHRFLKTAGEEEMMVDVLLANAPEDREVISRAVQTEAEVGPVRVADRNDLIRLKAIRNSDQDQVDIKGLQDDSDRESRKDGQ
ncbi:MAG: hypothetical protein A3K19_17150 [Lentisphaerae bacterium RIFOXYB12_FULL_65_16]|nr:MAG: hypothetical protein A3K18_03765 [Lentisphaerae bacterium RIFOXYA12_64_32]OGV87711.1 MAG: hypothetical protein A3K19_17150 [Lentisphaerae bacterium RIFOXYB12_FULL_65_16]